MWCSQLRLSLVLIIAAHVVLGEGGQSPSWKEQPTPYNGWTQQYGDPSSTSYTEYTGNDFRSGWNLTTQPFVSQASPCVDQYGVIYYPLRANIIAIIPNGTVLWKTGVSPNGNSYLTNIVYTNKHKFVIVGVSGVDRETLFQIVAVCVGNGSVAWTSKQNRLYDATTMSVSISADAVYVAGYDLRSFAAISLSDGKLIWEKKHIYQVGIFMQTKVGPASSGIAKRRTLEGGMIEEREIVLLPTDPYDGSGGKGRLFAYSTENREFTRNSFPQQF